MKTLTGLQAIKHILDPIHGMIPITHLELNLISTPIFQRLRNVTQLGLASWVYPGATHNRFQHSIGTMHVMDKLLYTLKLDEKLPSNEEESNRVIQIMRVAALLHDCGHMPFSHTFENYYENKNQDHENLGKAIIERSSLSEILQLEGIEPQIISELITGDFLLTDSSSSTLVQLLPLLHSDADADRMDYLLRDAYFSGVPFGKIDLDRICNFITLEGEKLCFNDKAQGALEDFLFSRYQMYKTVYAHKTVVCFELILLKLYGLLDKYRLNLTDPFILPIPEDLYLKSQEWFDNEFCYLTESRFFECIRFLLSGEISFENNDLEQLQQLNKCIRFRIPIKNCYRFDNLSLVSTKEYCEKESQLYNELETDYIGIINHWSFLRHNPEKPIRIATPIQADFDDEQDHNHIWILKKENDGISKPTLLQRETNSFISQWSTHHRVLIAYYHQEEAAQKTIRNLAEKYIS